MQDEVNTKVVAIMIKGGKISAEVLKKALDKFVQEIEKAQKQMQQPKTFRGKQSIKHLMSQNAAISNIEVTDGNIITFCYQSGKARCRLHYGPSDSFPVDLCPGKGVISLQNSLIAAVRLSFKETCRCRIAHHISCRHPAGTQQHGGRRCKMNGISFFGFL